jgi:hypothetical protein
VPEQSGERRLEGGGGKRAKGAAEESQEGAFGK